ncbi:LCP family protein [Sinomonas sp. R1AF57]|uniref:LCP family protein n=1 Tax=Sinomonas sp. R1AF57 TaxID=2020377 RepID=UPI000B612FE8|nr:LCP family protein [Sinomonas sp. R1AF57]ASN52833.1 transcriptional regulator [Sinomonas sp. R1AF57]
MIPTTSDQALGDEARPVQHRIRRRPRRGTVVLLVALAAVVGAACAAVVFLGSLATAFDSATQKIPTAFPQNVARPAEEPAADGKTAVNILLVGSDSRGAALSQAEAGVPSDQRSDTMLLVHIPADRTNAYVISIMRDTWVPIPGRGNAKVNAAFAFGGVPLMVETVESLLHQRIDHVALVDFEGFRAVTDAVGGVDVDVPVPFTAAQSPGYRFAAGRQKLTGDQALAFVRERYAFPDGDYQRVRDQQIFVKSLVGQVARPETLANPFTLSRVVTQLAPYLTVDSGFTSQAVSALAFELKDIRPSGIVSFTLPTAGTGVSPDGQSIVIMDDGATEALAAAMSGGTVAQYVAERNLQNGN